VEEGRAKRRGCARVSCKLVLNIFCRRRAPPVLLCLVPAADAYPSVPPWALAWPFRLRRVLAELKRHSPDVIALQVSHMRCAHRR
jgi:hypothetical protein